jgi:hypothetical protein
VTFAMVVTSFIGSKALEAEVFVAQARQKGPYPVSAHNRHRPNQSGEEHGARTAVVADRIRTELWTKFTCKRDLKPNPGLRCDLDLSEVAALQVGRPQICVCYEQPSRGKDDRDDRCGFSAQEAVAVALQNLNPSPDRSKHLSDGVGNRAAPTSALLSLFARSKLRGDLVYRVLRGETLWHVIYDRGMQLASDRRRESRMNLALVAMDVRGPCKAPASEGWIGAFAFGDQVVVTKPQDKVDVRRLSMELHRELRYLKLRGRPKARRRQELNVSKHGLVEGVAVAVQDFKKRCRDGVLFGSTVLRAPKLLLGHAPKLYAAQPGAVK